MEATAHHFSHATLWNYYSKQLLKQERTAAKW